MKSAKYNHKSVESKWQEYWAKKQLYCPDIKSCKNNFYNLWMFPYPSAEGLHAGHAFASTGSDVIGRYMRMKGFNVLQPIGYDSFGIHAENYALKVGEHPKTMLERVTKHYGEQMKKLGHGYDWTRSVTTSDPNYYKWTQWVFVQMFKRGLAYRKASEVNFCPSCKTVLADEQVMSPSQAGKKALNSDGTVAEDQENSKVCERCGYVIEKRNLEQWFFKITDYADRLLEGHNGIEWSERVIKAQKGWIGRSEGARIKFEIRNSNFEIEVFTTRPDTLYGATFLVVSPLYAREKLLDYINEDKKTNVSEYIHKHTNISIKSFEESGGSQMAEKTGVDTGIKAINPANGKEVSIFVSDYVLESYGTGAIMAVPAHDQRDFDFAKKFGLEIIPVIKSAEQEKKNEGDNLKSAYTQGGKIINSDAWNGWEYPKDYSKILIDIEKRGIGKKEKQYHLRDWIVSRQRYWGAPIPMIFCEKCKSEGKSWFTENMLRSNPLTKTSKKLYSRTEGETGFDLKANFFQNWSSAGWFPVDESSLPVELPHIKDYKPKGEGRGPLANHAEFVEAVCPCCGSKAVRETDVMDTFVDSSWYFLRYPSVGLDNSNDVAFDKEITGKWLPVNLYFGGAEHSVLHLMYSRFVTMMLHDAGYLDFGEPFPRFFAHGLLIKDGAKMSKSRGNVINPDEYIEKFGADTLRLYLLFIGPMDSSPDFRDTGIEGMYRFVNRIWRLTGKINKEDNNSRDLDILMHQTIKKVSKDIEDFRYNTAISAIMVFVNALEKQDGIDKKYLETLILLLAPFAPHLAEEMWQRINGHMVKRPNNLKRKKQLNNLTIQQFNSIHLSSWPTYDLKLVTEEITTIPVQVNGKLRATIKLKTEDLKLKNEALQKAKEDEKVQKWLQGKKIIKEIYIDGRLINFVTV